MEIDGDQLSNMIAQWRYICRCPTLAVHARMSMQLDRAGWNRLAPSGTSTVGCWDSAVDGGKAMAPIVHERSRCRLSACMGKGVASTAGTL
jgi:hypothetical protein